MLRELRGVRQDSEGKTKRWFHGRDIDLIVWTDSDGATTRFQLCYNKMRDEHSLLWTAAGGFLHERVDAGEDNPHKNQTPVMVNDGEYHLASIAETFRRHAGEIDVRVRGFVLDRLGVPAR